MPTATLVRRTLVGVVAGAAATAAIAGVRLAADGSPSPTTTTVAAGVQVLQVEQYCRRLPDFVAAFPDTPSAQGWVCQYLKGDAVTTKELGQRDMNEACRLQVADDRSKAIALDQRDPHSWRCTDPSLAPDS